MKNGREWGGRDFKIGREIMKPNARNRNYLHSPLTSTIKGEPMGSSRHVTGISDFVII